jgi:sirohydrochlorin ferrochelatase
MSDLVIPQGFRPETTGIMIVDHGSRRLESNRRHEEFVLEWQTRYRFPIVEPAHMEFAEPSIRSGFEACVVDGATTIVIAPYFLWPGNHWDRDIPALAAAASAPHPGVPYLVTAPLGPHRLLMNIVQERIEYCLSHAVGMSPE